MHYSPAYLFWSSLFPKHDCSMANAGMWMPIKYLKMSIFLDDFADSLQSPRDWSFYLWRVTLKDIHIYLLGITMSFCGIRKRQNSQFIHTSKSGLFVFYLWTLLVYFADISRRRGRTWTWHWTVSVSGSGMWRFISAVNKFLVAITVRKSVSDGQTFQNLVFHASKIFWILRLKTVKNTKLKIAHRVYIQRLSKNIKVRATFFLNVY